MKFKLISITIAALVLAACSARDTTHHLSIN
ncbi:hypothetical protein O1Q80_01102 [Lonepinella sp. MS14435]